MSKSEDLGSLGHIPPGRPLAVIVSEFAGEYGVGCNSIVDGTPMLVPPIRIRTEQDLFNLLQRTMRYSVPAALRGDIPQVSLRQEMPTSGPVRVDAEELAQLHAEHGAMREMLANAEARGDLFPMETAKRFEAATGVDVRPTSEALAEYWNARHRARHRIPVLDEGVKFTPIHGRSLDGPIVLDEMPSKLSLWARLRMWWHTRGQ